MHQCFKEGTLVETEDGLKPIEEIQVGDKVLAYDEETGGQAYKKVVHLFRNETNYWCTVKVKPENGQEAFEIVSTPGHKYYLPDNTEKRDIGKRLEHIGYWELSEKWVSAESLKYGDRVLLFDGTFGIIQSVEVNQLATSEITYNLEVEEFHTYYVGEQRVVVHNANCGGVDDLVLDVKKENYISKRGWTKGTIDAAIKNGIKGTTTNLATNNIANVYTAANGSYVVVDSVTNQLVQLSQFGNLSWIPNPPIIWL